MPISMYFCFVVLHAEAATACRPLPSPVRAYLLSQPGWKILGVDDLVKSDQNLWNQYHSRQCPGLATVDLRGNGMRTYAMALLHREGERATERLIALTPDREPAAYTLVESQRVTVLSVVWRAGPGESFNIQAHKNLSLKNDSIVFEEMESNSRTFYLSNGKFRSFLSAD
jgi:hypothetical protein